LHSVKPSQKLGFFINDNGAPCAPKSGMLFGISLMAISAFSAAVLFRFRQDLETEKRFRSDLARAARS
jgi:hypothetical protein